MKLHGHARRNMQEAIEKSYKKILRQYPMFLKALVTSTNACDIIAEDRANHILTLEHNRQKKFYDDMNEFQDIAIEDQGQDDYMEFLKDVKNQIFENNNEDDTNAGINITRAPARTQLREYSSQWQETVGQLQVTFPLFFSDENMKTWHRLIKKGKYLSKKTGRMEKQTKKEEWKMAKNYYIRIGKHGHIARMINPKNRTGPTACNFYPTLQGVPGKKAITDEERQEASIITHTMWMANPPGGKNCHFLDITQDEVGPNGVSICADKLFDEDAEWQYLNGPLDSKKNIISFQI